MPEEIVILSAGMVTAIGLSAPETAASVRSLTSRFVALDMRDKVFEPFIAATLPALPPVSDKVAGPLTNRESRLLRLTGIALAEACKPLAPSSEKPPLLLALPDAETRLPLDRPRFLCNLALHSPHFTPPPTAADCIGRAGGLLAVHSAAALITSGKAQIALAGGADTCIDPWVLATLDLEKRVKSTLNLDGFIPGEGAAFLLLATRSTADRLRLRPLAAISPVASGMETGHLYSTEPYLGEGLAGTLQTLLTQSPPKAPIAATWSSMNGESHWGKEWGVAFNRNRSAFAPAAAIYHPADCYGDTGAASGPLMVGLAALGIAGGYRAAPALVYCSSDRGQRAAVLVNGA